MILQYPTDSKEALAAIASPEPKNIWIHGSVTEIRTGEDCPVSSVEIPAEVTRFQALAAMELAGYLTQVEAIIGDAKTPKLTKLAFANAQSFRRDSPMLEGMAKLSGLSNADLDALFVAAAGILV